MRLKVLQKGDFDDFVQSLMAKYEVVGPKCKDGIFVFDRLESPDELRLDYDTTLLPPKKCLLPQREKLLKYRVGTELDVEAHKDAPECILFGVHRPRSSTSRKRR